MPEYLMFIKDIGQDIQNNYIYQFDFTEDTETAWGDKWEQCPAGIVPNIGPDINMISSSIKVITPICFNLAKDNTCFSMQDCIDGIIALGFTDIEEETEEIFHFGEDKESVIKKVEKYKFENIAKDNNEDAIVDAFINQIDNNG